MPATRWNSPGRAASLKTEFPLLLALLVACPVAWTAWRLPPERSWLARPPVFIAVWLGLLLLPYVAFGRDSFLWMDDEGDLLVPHYLLTAGLRQAGVFSHLLGAGGDLRGSFLIGGEFLSPERLLMAALPLWLAVAAHKALTCLFALVGTYLVARRMGGARREAALALGALASVLWFRMILVTYGTGMTLAVVPLGAYLLVGRLGRRRYWTGVLAYAVVAALWTNPNEGAPAIAVATLGCMVWQRRLALRPLLGVTVVGLAILANWCEALYGMLQMMAESSRVTNAGSGRSALQDMAKAAGHYLALLGMPLPLGLTVLPLAILAVLGRRELPRAAMALAMPLVLLTSFYLFPWAALGFAGIKNASADYMLFGVTTITALIAARAMRLWADHDLERQLPRRPGLGLPTLVATVAAFATLGWYVGFELITLFYRSGQAHYHAASLTRPTWLSPDQPRRVVSIRGAYLQPEPNTLLAHGLPAFDVWLNLMDRRVRDYWVEGIQLSGSNDTRIGFDWGKFPDGVFQVGEVASLPLLAAANVGYLLSATPVAGDGLELIEGPAHPPVDKPSRSGAKAWDYYRDRWNRIFDIGPLYVYRLPDPLPRVWAAERVAVVDDALSTHDMLAEVAKLARDRVAVVRAAAPVGPAAIMSVSHFDLVPEGFEIDVVAPSGGVLVVNALASHFFHAAADGREIAISDANGIQMAMTVPAGTRHVSVCYQRPMLFPAMLIASAACGKVLENDRDLR